MTSEEILLETPEGGPPLEQRWTEFVSLLCDHQEQDVRRQSLRTALAMEVETPGDVELSTAHAIIPLARDLLADNPEMGASYCFTKLLRSLSYILRREGTRVDGYPKDFTTPERWLQAITEIYANNDLRERFEDAARNRPLQSNVTERYVGTIATYQLLRLAGRMPEDDAKLVDIGCSLNTGLRWIALRALSQLDIPKVMAKQDGAMRVDSRQTAAFGHLLGGGIPLREGIGVDITSPYHDDDSRLWAIENRFNPSELVTLDKYWRFFGLVLADVATVDFIEADFTAPSPTLLERLSGTDMAIFSTMLYQIKDPFTRIEMLGNAAALSRFTFIQDFMTIHPGVPVPHFDRLWLPRNGGTVYPYRGAIIDNETAANDRNERGVITEVFSAFDGRMDTIAVSNEGSVRTHPDSPYSGTRVTFAKLFADYAEQNGF